MKYGFSEETVRCKDPSGQLKLAWGRERRERACGGTLELPQCCGSSDVEMNVLLKSSFKGWLSLPPAWAVP